MGGACASDFISLCHRVQRSGGSTQAFESHELGARGSFENGDKAAGEGLGLADEA